MDMTSVNKIHTLKVLFLANKIKVNDLNAEQCALLTSLEEKEEYVEYTTRGFWLFQNSYFEITALGVKFISDMRKRVADVKLKVESKVANLCSKGIKDKNTIKEAIKQAVEEEGMSIEVYQLLDFILNTDAFDGCAINTFVKGYDYREIIRGNFQDKDIDTYFDEEDFDPLDLMFELAYYSMLIASIVEPDPACEDYDDMASEELFELEAVPAYEAAVMDSFVEDTSPDENSKSYSYEESDSNSYDSIESD